MGERGKNSYCKKQFNALQAESKNDETFDFLKKDFSVETMKMRIRFHNLP